MSLFKKKLTEQEAASLFILYLTKEAQGAWPTIKKSLENTFQERFIVTEEDMVASFNLALAAIAQDLQALKNLFEKDQAERIEKWVLKSLTDIEDWGEYAIGEVKKYSDGFQKALNNIERYGNPINVIPVLLLYKWLGKNIDNIEVKINGKKTGYFDPLIVQMVTHILVQFAGTWKKRIITNDIKLVEGDIPFDENLNGLKDYVPEPDEKKPDGTIQYFDENGNLQEKHISPEHLKELIKSGVAQLICKALIKGPWDGVKEAYWELSPETIKKFSDENGHVYAICAYEKGEPKYTLTKKEIWDNMEEVEKILMNPDLSEEQRLEEIKKIAED